MNLIGQKDEMLDILVENQGHINFGSYINGNRKVVSIFFNPFSANLDCNHFKSLVMCV